MKKIKYDKRKNYPLAAQQEEVNLILDKIDPMPMVNSEPTEEKEVQKLKAEISADITKQVEIPKSKLLDEVKSELKEPTFKQEKSGKIVSTNSSKRKHKK